MDWETRRKKRQEMGSADSGSTSEARDASLSVADAWERRRAQRQQMDAGSEEARRQRSEEIDRINQARKDQRSLDLAQDITLGIASSVANHWIHPYRSSQADLEWESALQERPQQMSRWAQMEANAYAQKQREAQRSLDSVQKQIDEIENDERVGAYHPEYQNLLKQRDELKSAISGYGEQLKSAAEKRSQIQQYQAQVKAAEMQSQIAENPANFMRWARMEADAYQKKLDETEYDWTDNQSREAYNALNQQWHDKIDAANALHDYAQTVMLEQEAAAYTGEITAPQNTGKLYRLVNDKTRWASNQTRQQQPEGNRGADSPDAFMSETQRNTFNYLAGVKGEDAAEAYYELIKPQLEAARSANTAAEWAERTDEHPYLSTVTSVLMSPLKIPAGLASVAKASFGVDVNTNDVLHQVVHAQNAIRQTAPEVTNWTGDATIFGQDADTFIYGTITSALDSALNMVISGVITGAAGAAVGGFTAGQTASITSNLVSGLMGAEMLPDTIMQEKAKGRSDSEAVAIGIIRSLVEGITEKYSVEAFLSDPRGVAKRLEKAFVAEGSEEVASNWLNRIVDIAVKDPDNLKAQYDRLKESGAASGDALTQVIFGAMEEDAGSFLAGGISGLAMGGAAELADYTQRLQAYTQKGQQILDSGNYDTLQALAMDVAKEGVYGKGESELSRFAEKTAAGVKNLNENYDDMTQRQVNRATRNVGKLADRVDTVRQQQNAADIQAMLEKKGMSARDAKKAAQLISENYEGLVDPEDKDLQRVMAKPEVRETMKEIADDSNSSVRQRNYRYNLGLMGLKLDENGIAVPVRRKKEEPAAESVTTAEADKNASVEISDGVSGKVQGIKWDNGILTATVITEAGETVSAPVEDVSMPSEMQDLVAVSKQFGESAPAVYAAYQPGMGVAEYGAAMKLASDYGYTGVSRSYADSSEYLNGLHPAQISIAYEAGQAAWTKESTETMRTQSKGTVFANRKAGKVSMKGGTVDGVTYKAVDRSGMTAQQKAAARNIARLAQVTGINFVFYQSEKNSAGKYSGANGIYTDNTIFLDINAGATDSVTEAAILRTAAHELTHFIEQFSKSEYRALQEFMLKNLEGYKGKTIDQLVAEKQARSKKDMSFQDAMSEIVADGCEMMLQDTRIMELLASEHEGIAKKISRWLKNWVEDLKAAFTGVEAVHEEAKAMIAHAEELQKLWDNALMQALRNREQNADTLENVQADHDLESELADAGIKYSERVTDEDTLSFLNGQKTITTYKTMQLVDGKLYPPMASRINGKFEDYSELGVWEQATEHPELIRENGKFKLDKGKGQGSIDAAYNPYMHSSNLVINDQFSGAYKRKNLVTVECVVPVSEVTSGYHAQYAKDSVGWHPWHTGTVAGSIRKAKGVQRQVFLSRWIKPVRIVPDSEVASMYKELLSGTDVAVPDNVVTPSLLKELKKAGVKIEESGRVIGKSGYKKEASQLINAKSSDVTVKTGSANASIDSIRNNGKEVKSTSTDDMDIVDSFVSEYKEKHKVIEYSDHDLEGDIKYSIRDFAEQVDEVLAGTFDRTNAVFVGNTPEILRKVGLNGDLPMLTTASHIRKAVLPKDERSHQHGLTEKQVKRLPQEIASPVMILDSLNVNSNSVIVVTSMIDIDKMPVIATIRADGTGTYNDVEVNSNFLTSYYGRRNFAGFIDRMVAADKVLYVDKKRATSLEAQSSSQWLEKLQGYDSSVIIRKTSASVKLSDRDYSYEALTSKPDMTVTLVDDTAPKNRADIIHQAKKNAAGIGTFDPKTGSVSVRVNDINTDVILATNGLKHSMDRRTEVNGPVVVKAGEILQNSIRINELTPQKADAQESYVLIGAAQNNSGELYVVRSVINRFSNELSSMDVLYAINAKKESAALNAPRLADESAIRTDSTISISELLDYVNRYFPDVLPESVLKHYGYDARPDGKIGESALFQDRDPDQISNRALLANALDSAVKNDIERKRLEEYRGKIDLLNSEEQKLQGLRSEIRELSFAKGPKDTKRIRELQFEANQTANRINIIDRQLLRLEAAAPLQNVLQREKQMAYKRAEQKGKETLAAYREKATKTQREIISRYQESRAKGIDSRKRTAMRGKIKDVVNELNNYLLKGTKDRHVPESLRKAVAEALDAVNMDTVGAEERIAKLQQEMMKAKTPEKIQEIARKIDHIREMDDKMSDRLKKLQDAYDDIRKSPDENTRNSYDEVIYNKLESVIDKIGDTPLRNMTLTQLEDVYDMYRMVLTAVRDVNKSFKDEKKRSISVRANAVMDQVDEVGGKRRMSPKILSGIEKFGWDNLKPVYAFEHIGSQTLTEAFRNVRKGEDVWAVDVTEAREFYLDKSRKYHYDSWDFNKQYTFTSTSGMDFRLNLEQILSLYAYSKRKQAADHLKYGGIVFDPNTDVVKTTKHGIKVTYDLNDATAYNINDETLGDIISNLTDEQKAFADEMQDYLSTVMGSKGNEVSMEMYGIRLFREQNYFPLKSAQQFMEKARDQAKGEVKIKNSGFSKETAPKAKNPIVLSGFMDVWASHVNDMSMYHAFVLPMEDFYRIYNYKTPSNNENQATEGVNQYIENAYGRAATAYIDQLLKDLNGGARTDPRADFVNKMMGKFKKGAVFASASVVIQQPSAIARATALVDAKYFIGPKIDSKRHKALWEEVKQYAPVAIIKEMGYFDTNMGKSTEDFITGREYSGIHEKAKAMVSDSNYRDEVLSRAPALADEIAWCGIWEAVKRETKEKHPGLDTNAEPFLKLCGDRFTEVITKTQVYDSVLSRSALMRSKDTGAKMVTAFMAEPTTSLNMIVDALVQGKRGNVRYCRTAIGSVIAAQILNSILVSFVYAARDDDDDETYLEKYIGSVSGAILDGLNPLTYIPFIKDIVSVVKGYDVERADMSIVSDIMQAWENLSKDTVTPYRKVEGFAGSIANLFGLPVKNIMRDARSIYQVVSTFMNGQKTSKAGIGYAIRGAITGKTVSDKQRLYDAYLSGDKTEISRSESRFQDQSAIDSAIRSALRENDPRIREAAISWNANDLDEYMRIAKAIINEGRFVQDNVVLAIRAEANKLAEDGAESADTSKANGLFTSEKFAEAISQGDEAMANTIKTDIIQTEQKNGKTMEEAEKSFNSSASRSCKELFLEGEISADKAVKSLFDYCGLEKDEAEKRVGEWASRPIMASPILTVATPTRAVRSLLPN